MEIDRTTCGICPVEGSEECAVCFKHLCHGVIHQKICTECLIATTEQAVQNGQPPLHPLTQTPLPMCKCGKAWIGDCRMWSMPGVRITNRAQLEAECTTPAERLAAVRSGKYSVNANLYHGRVV